MAAEPARRHTIGSVAAPDHGSAPLLDAVAAHVLRDSAPFHTPGHKSGGGTPAELAELLGWRAMQADLTTLPSTDNLNNPTGAIAEAERLAADAWGADDTLFLVNGSTIGNNTMFLAACRPGDTVIVPRSMHRSAFGALVLCGARPIYVAPEWDRQLRMPYGVDAASIRDAVMRHPEAVAAYVVSPNYYGATSDLAAIADLCHRRGMPLLVDEAWGAHQKFHPELPPSALECGADVVVQSTHKTLASMTQSSMLHVRGDRVPLHRGLLGLLHSTSPSYLLLASLDAARRQMVLDGERLLGGALALARDLRARLRELPGLLVVGTEIEGMPGVARLDETRIVVNVAATGLSGFEVRDLLESAGDVHAEMATLDNVVFIVSFGNTERDIDRLVDTMARIAHEAPGGGASSLVAAAAEAGAAAATAALPEQALTPREAFFAPEEAVPFEQAVGRISTEIVAPYPPGIPVIAPGEVVSADAVRIVRAVQAAGGAISGPRDTSLDVLHVVARRG